MATEEQSAAELAEEWVRRERRFRADHYHGTGESGEVELTERGGRFSISAPHSLNHFRDRAVKIADICTGSMAELLGARLGASTLVPVGPIEAWDTWVARDDDFRIALDRMVATTGLHIDLHGMLSDHGVDICIGLGPHPSDTEAGFADHLTTSLDGYVVTTNDPFGAKADFTVTSYLQTSARVPSVQLEVSADFRDPKGRPAESAELLTRLSAAIHGFAAH